MYIVCIVNIVRTFPQTREHCLQLLEDAFKANFRCHHCGDLDKMAAIDYEPRACAIDEEHAAFKMSKQSTLYKAAVMRKVNEIKNLTNSHRLHSALVPKFASLLTPASQLLKGNRLPGFMLASSEGQCQDECQGQSECQGQDECQSSGETNHQGENSGAVTPVEDSSGQECGRGLPNMGVSPVSDGVKTENGSTVPRLFYSSTLTDYGADKADISLVLLPRPPAPKIKYFFECDTSDADKVKDQSPGRWVHCLSLHVSSHVSSEVSVSLVRSQWGLSVSSEVSVRSQCL